MLKFFDYFIYILAFIFLIFLGYSIFNKKMSFKYTFIPRTFKEETENPVSLNNYFDSLFS